MTTSITVLYTTITGTKDDFKIDWKEDAKADWKVDWATGVEPVKPSNTVLPHIAASSLSVAGTGMATVTPGTWTGTPAPVITHQWRNDSGNIAGATGLTYTLQASDIGKGIACVETATNSVGVETKTSNIIGPVVA